MFIIGMMSGTSLDGIDAVLAEYHKPDNKAGQGSWQVVAHAEASVPAALKNTLYQLNFPGKTPNELHVAKTAEQQLTRGYAQAYRQLMCKTSVAAAEIAVIAAHGQTIRHEPNASAAYTLQLLNGALLSQLTGQTVVCDFRSKDIAAGGQGAPLAPLFHRQLFAQNSTPLAVVNIGGISNISVLTDNAVLGFDCGPGNCLLDEWISKHCGKAFDENGDWARQGRILPDVLTRLLADRYFSLPAPKSTGREIFHLGWLQAVLNGSEAPVDVMRTLVRLTATVIAKSVPDDITQLTVVGGGAKNPLLMADIAALLPHLVIQNETPFDAQHVEALGFALLGRAALLRQPLETQAITGAKQAVILGAVYYNAMG